LPSSKQARGEVGSPGAWSPPSVPPSFLFKEKGRGNQELGREKGAGVPRRERATGGL
jgi:hypothetical protein